MEAMGYSNETMEVFISYHFTTRDLKHNGFGNFVGLFNKEVYKNNLGTFIEDAQKSIEMALEDKLEIKCVVKVLFFR